MSDVVERAEAALATFTAMHDARPLLAEVVAELKGARAKYSADYAEFSRIRGDLVAELVDERAENERLQGEFRKARGWKFGPCFLVVAALTALFTPAAANSERT